MSLHRVLPVAAGIFLSCTGAFGQNGGGEEPPTVELRTLAIDPQVKAELFVAVDGEYEKLPFSHYQPSAQIFEVSVPGGGIEVFRKGVDEAGESAHLPYKNVAVPQGARRILLLAGSAGGGGVTLACVGDNFSRGDDREWLLVNATKRMLAFQLGEGTDPVPVPPGKSVPFRVQVDAGRGAAVRVAAFFDDGWERFYSTFWPVYEEQRGLVVFVPDAQKEVRLMNFFESVREENTEEAGAASP